TSAQRGRALITFLRSIQVLQAAAFEAMHERNAQIGENHPQLGARSVVLEDGERLTVKTDRVLEGSAPGRPSAIAHGAREIGRYSCPFARELCSRRQQARLLELLDGPFHVGSTFTRWPKEQCDAEVHACQRFELHVSLSTQELRALLEKS